MGSFPTSVAQRLLKQLFVSPTASAFANTTEPPLYNHTLTGTGGLSGTASTNTTVTLYVGLLWHFSANVTGPAVSGGFPGGNSFASTGGITDAHIVSKGVWSNITSGYTYASAGVACSLTNNVSGSTPYAGRLAELTNGGFTGKGNVSGSSSGNGLLRKAIKFTASGFDDTPNATSPSVTSDNPASTGTAIAFGTFTKNDASTAANFDGISMTAANCSIVGFFITPLAGSAIAGSWGSSATGTNGVGDGSAVNANTPWIIAYGQLSNSRSINTGDQPQFTAAAITITLA